MKRTSMVVLGIMIASAAYAQTHDRRMTDHRLPDREASSAGLQMFQFGKSRVGEKVYVPETPSFNEYKYNMAKFVTTDGRKPIKVEITQPAGTPIFLDEVHMEFEGKMIKPTRATADGKDVTGLLTTRDEQSTSFQDLVLEFPPTGKAEIGEATIVFTASRGQRASSTELKQRDEGPKVYQTTKYYDYKPGSKKGVIEYDGTITPKDGLGRASFRETIEPVAGGSKKPLYVWVRDDGSNLYVVLEVAADTSVGDMDDKTILYVRGNGPLASFVAGEGGGAYGRMGTYEGSTYAEHRVYEFQIPFSQLPRLNAKGKWGISFAVTM